ncbi:hypothetical protein QE152_g32123 [Popillia japonica]|uniref:Galectin n=1 Tax=Popillia japonica TaxID=7064 RepID=A0AAW1J0S9_POPJA
MSLFHEVSVSLNNGPERAVTIDLSDTYIYIHFDENEILALQHEKCIPCRYKVAIDIFVFYTNNYEVQLRFGNSTDKMNFKTLTFPYWKYEDDNLMPTKSPPSPPQTNVPPNSLTSTPSNEPLL